MTSDLGRYYVQHYFNLANFGKYLIVAIIGLAAVMAVMLTIAWQQRQATERSIREHFSYDREAYAHDARYRRRSTAASTAGDGQLPTGGSASSRASTSSCSQAHRSCCS